MFRPNHWTHQADAQSDPREVFILTGRLWRNTRKKVIVPCGSYLIMTWFQNGCTGLVAATRASQVKVRWRGAVVELLLSCTCRRCRTKLYSRSLQCVSRQLRQSLLLFQWSTEAMPFGGEPNGVVMMMLEHCSRQIQCVIETVAAWRSLVGCEWLRTAMVGH